MKYLFALALCLPLGVSAAEDRPLASFHCTSRSSAQSPGVKAHAMAPVTEFSLKHGLIKAELANVDAIADLALVQFSHDRLKESAATTQLVRSIWSRQAPSAEAAARIRQQAQRYHRQTDCSAAQAMYQLALGMAFQSVGERHVLTVGIMSDLAKLYHANRQASTIAPLYQRMAAALAATPAIGAQQPELYVDMSNLAYGYRDFALAERYARTALGHVDNGMAAHRRTLIGALDEQAAALYALGRLDQGDKLRERARQLALANGAKRWPPAPLSPDERIGALYRSGDLAGAASKLKQDLLAAQASQASLATALARLTSDAPRKPADQALARQRAIDTARRDLDRQEYAVIHLLIVAAELEHSQQRLAEAQSHYRRALAMLKTMNLDNSSLAGRASHGLGVLLRAKGVLAEAETLQARSYEIAQTSVGADHPDAVEARAELAYLAAAQGKLAEAASHYAALAAIAQRDPLRERVALSRYLLGLASVQLKQGNPAGAEAQLNRVHRLWREGGTRHDAMLTSSLNGLAALYAHQHRSADARRIEAELATLNSVK